MNRQTRTRIACVVTAALAVTWGGPAANAYWQALGSNAGAARADSLQAVAAPLALASSGAASVSWQQGTTAAGRPIARYTVARYASAAGGTRVAAGGECAGNIAALTCTEAALPAGTWYYTVTPVLGAWAGAESARSAGVAAADTTPPPTPTITAPALITSGTVGSVQLSGSAEPLSSVTISATDANGVPAVPMTVSATSSGQWNAALNLNALAEGTVSYSVVAKDAAGNVSVVPGTAASTKDAVLPTARVELKNAGTPGLVGQGDSVVIAYTDVKASMICSDWTNDSANYTVTGNSVVTIKIDAANKLTATVAAGNGCAGLRIGELSLGGSYAGTTAPITFAGTGNGGNASSMTWNGTDKTLTLTLGKLASGTPATVAAPTGNPLLTPTPGVTDANGNQAVGAAATAPSRF